MGRQLQIWDYRGLSLLREVGWRSGQAVTEPCLVYSAQFSKSSPDLLVACGSGANECKVFDMTSKDAGAVGCVAGASRALYTVDFANTTDTFAVAGGDGHVTVVGVN